MSRKQSDAVKTRIQLVPALASKTFKSIVPRGTIFPYVVIHGSDGTDSAERLGSGRTTMHPRFALHIVGETADQVEALTGLVKAQFIHKGLGIPLTVAGETCESLWWSMPIPIQVDSDPLPQIAYAVIELGWEANPI